MLAILFWNARVPAAQSAQSTLAIVGARIQPAPDLPPIMDGAVLLNGGTLEAVGPRDKVSIPSGTRTIDGKGLIVLGGFQNSHVHFTEEHWADAPTKPAATLQQQLERMLTRYGFTTVVDTASLLQNTLSLRRRIEANELLGPRILTAGLALYPPDGVPFYLRETVAPEVLKLLPQPAAPEEAQRIVTDQAAAGADVVKLFAGSWVSRGKVLPIPEGIAAAAVAEAHAKGKLVFAHPSNVAGLDVALKAGVDILAHAVEDARGFTADHQLRLRQQKVAIVPTFTLFGRDRFFWEIGDIVREHARAGGQILFGTDVGFLTEYDPTREYSLMAATGFSWREILASLTTNPAARFGEAERRGRIAAGLDADLVLLGSDPATDVKAFADVRYVIRRGRIIFPSSPS